MRQCDSGRARQCDSGTVRQRIGDWGLGLTLRHVMNCKLSFYRKELGDRAEKHRIPANRYIIAFVSYASNTEILRLRLRMTMRAGRQGR